MLDLRQAVNCLSLVLWRRPEYTKRVLDSLSRCDGISSYIIIIGIDGEGSEEVVKLARAVSFCPTLILLHNQHKGCNLNTKLTLMYAFQHFDYVIHLEDDTPLAPDGLRFFEWARQFGNDPAIYTVSGWGLLPKPPSSKDDPAKAVRRGHYSCWTWATWKDRWQEMQQGWTTGDDQNASWDYRVGELRGNRAQIQPVVSRTINIGAELGTHRGDYPLTEWAGMKGFKAPEKYVADWL